MARAALYHLEAQCWQIIILVSAGIVALALAVFYGLQHEAEISDIVELRATPCVRKDYGMAWDDQELKMDGGEFDQLTGIYEPHSDAPTWNDTCPSLVAGDLDAETYESALVDIISQDVCSVRDCKISFLSQFWQQRCRDIDYGTAQRNCEATCVSDGDCLDSPAGGPPGPWLCPAGQAAQACVTRCELAVQKLNGECLFMRDESSPYFHPTMVRQTLNYLSGDTCASSTCTDEELDISTGPLNARHRNRCSYSTFGDLVLNNCERKGCMDDTADSYAGVGFEQGMEGEEVECITASCPAVLPEDILEDRNLSPTSCSSTGLGDTCTATCKPGYFPEWQYGMGGTATERTVPSGGVDLNTYANPGTYGPTCTGSLDACADVRGTALETPDACDAMDGCSYTVADISALPAALPLRCALDSTWDARGALMCIPRACDENIDASQRMPNQVEQWCAGELGAVCNFECELGYNKVGGPTCTGTPSIGACAFRGGYGESDCRPRHVDDNSYDSVDNLGPSDCTYAPSQHTCLESPDGSSFQGGVCEAAPCTRGLQIAGAEQECSGSTGDVCVFTCGEDFLRMGEHVCMPDGEFRGGECTDIPCNTESGIDVEACGTNPPDEDGDGVPDRPCTAAASTQNTISYAKYAFDGLSSAEEVEYQHSLTGHYHFWESSNTEHIGTTTPATLAYELATEQPVCSYAITGPRTDGRGPKSFVFQGGRCICGGSLSQDRADCGNGADPGNGCEMNWYDLDTQTNVAWTPYQRRVFAIEEDNWNNNRGRGYYAYQLKVTEAENEWTTAAGYVRSAVQVTELEIFPVATIGAVFPGDLINIPEQDLRDEFANALGSMLGCDPTRIVVTGIEGGSVVVSFYIKAPDATAAADEPSTVQAYKTLQRSLADPTVVEAAFAESVALQSLGAPTFSESATLTANPCVDIAGLDIPNGSHNCTASSMKSGSICTLTCDENSRPADENSRPADGVMSCFMGNFTLKTCIAVECPMLPGGLQFEVPGGSHDCMTATLNENHLQHGESCQITCDLSPLGTPLVPSEGGTISCLAGELSGHNQACIDPSCIVVEALNGTNVSRLEFTNGAHDCPDIMVTNSSCNVMCSDGYAATGAGTVECLDSNLLLDSGEMTLDVCQRVQCVPDSTPTSDPMGCACDEGYTGTISWDAAASSWDGACAAVDCVADSSKVDVGCVCNAGYSGSVWWTESFQGWSGSCDPLPCTSNSTPTTFEYTDDQVSPPETRQVTVGLADEMQAPSGTQSRVTCQSWNPDFRGYITLSCDLGELSLVNSNCTHHDQCAAGEDDCISDLSAYGTTQGAVCQHTGPAEHVCLCPAGFYGNGVDMQRTSDITDTSCRPCPDNSGASIVGDLDSRAEHITGCICNSGYTVSPVAEGSQPTQDLASDTESCVHVPCPEDTIRSVNDDNTPGPCVCRPGYTGDVTFDQGTNSYTHTCVPEPCDADTPPVLYTHADVNIIEASCLAIPGSVHGMSDDSCNSAFQDDPSTCVSSNGCTLQDRGQRTGPIGLSLNSSLSVGEQVYRDCADWNETFRGTITLRCQFEDDAASSRLSIFGDTCEAHTPCDASTDDLHDCDTDATCQDTRSTLGPGTHDCACNANYYGDGFTGTDHTSAEGVPAGCMLCPEFSTTSEVATARRVSDCTCNAGYTTGGVSTEISSSDQSCTPVPCPEFSDGQGAGASCQCIAGYSGNIQWIPPAVSSLSGEYSGTCEPDCPDGYTFSHYGVFDVSSDPFFPTDSDALSQVEYDTVAGCSAICEGDAAYGCIAYSFEAATASSLSVCRRYSTNESATEQSGATACLKTLAACPVSDGVPYGVTEGEADAVQAQEGSNAGCVGNGTQACPAVAEEECPIYPGCTWRPAIEAIEGIPAVPACGGTVQSGETCALTCNSGYSADLGVNPQPTAQAGLMFCYDGLLARQDCDPNPCVASLPVQNGDLEGCGDQVPHGTSCEMSCNVGYAPSGDGLLLCTLGDLEEETCQEVPCPASATGGAGADCVCDAGYTGTIEWNADASASRGRYDGQCDPNPCASASFQFNDAVVSTEITIPSGSDDAVDCNTWHVGYRGSIILSCTLGNLTVTDGTNCTAIDLCVDGLDDCHSEDSTCIYDGPGTHVCECNTGYWGNGHGSAGCQSCPTHSTTSDSTTVVTDCECNSGYYNSETQGTSILTSASQCEPVPCPENSAATNTGPYIVGAEQACTCSEGFTGEVTWYAELNAYASTCEPICPVGAVEAVADCVPSNATWLDAGITCTMTGVDPFTCGSEPFVSGACSFVPAVANSPAYTWSHAGQWNTYWNDELFASQNMQNTTVGSIAECANLCGYGCAAFSLLGDTGLCHLFSAVGADGVTTSSGSASCLKTVAPCDGSVSVTNRADEDCDAEVQSGTSCDLTCATGYQPSLPVESSDFAVTGQMFCFDGSLAVQTCEQVTCDMTNVVFDTCTGIADVIADTEIRPTCDLDPTTDNTTACPSGCTSAVATTRDCGTELPVGSTCTLVCPPGFEPSPDGAISCQDLQPGSALVAPTCAVVECPADSDATADRSACTCHSGYSGVVQWNDLTMTYDGSCSPNDCDRHTSGPIYTYDNQAREINLAMNEVDAQTIPHGSSGSVECQDWNSNYRGSIGLECSAGVLTIADGATCTAWNRCSVEEDHDCHEGADCEHTGPGTHTCICSASNTYGDGYQNAEGCEACPTNAAVNPRPTNRSTVVTDCDCIGGYTGNIVDPASTCTAVPCPDDSTGNGASNGAGEDCTCDSGYVGVIQWQSDSNSYDGSCTAICPSGYTYSHAGVLGDAAMADVAAGQTITSCSSQCEDQWGCLAFSFAEACNIDGQDASDCCSRFDTTNGPQAGPTDGTAHSCLREVEPCSADLNFAFGSNDCGDAIASGSSCTLTCDTGYTESGSGSIDCFDGQLAGGPLSDDPDGQQCTPSACAAPETIANSYSVCTSTVESGSSCAVTCSEGFSVPATSASCTAIDVLNSDMDCSTGYVAGNGTTCPSSCRFTASSNRSRTVAMQCLYGNLPPVQCAADPCSIEPAMLTNTQEHDCGTQIDSSTSCEFICNPGFHAGLVGQADGTIQCSEGTATPSGSCTEVSCPDFADYTDVGVRGSCTCVEGYEGTIVWNGTSGVYEGTCSESACDSTTAGVTWVFDGESADVVLSEGTEIGSGLTGTASCQQWNANYRGQIDMMCELGELQTAETAECTPFNPCLADEDDCHALAICNSTGAGTHTCMCDSGYGNGTMCTNCPTNAAVNPRPTDRSTVVTDCDCIGGYTGNIVDPASTCTAVPCPDDSTGNGAGEDCTCDSGYAGVIQWQSDSNSYDGSCTAICPSGYTYSHAGVLGDAAMADVAAGQTITSCSSQCEDQWGCLAFTVSAIDNDSGSCALYASATGAQNIEQSAHTCNRVVEPCGNVTIASGAHTCVSGVSPDVASGTGCTLVCNDGYTVGGTGELSCFDGEYSAPTCDPSDCTIPDSFAVDSGDSACTGTVAHGDTCSITCNANYSPSGDGLLLCSFGAMEVETCNPNPCGLDTVIANGTHDCTYPVNSGTACTLTCDDGFVPSSDGQMMCTEGVLALESCVQVECSQPGHVRSPDGSCVCDNGYTGEVSWIDDQWSGSCSAIPCKGVADGVTATTVEYTIGTVTSTFQLQAGEEAAADASTSSYDCSYWNADFYGTIDADCNIGPEFSISGDNCMYINACNGDNDCSTTATCDSTASDDCAAANPPNCGAHSCYCSVNSFGDGLAQGSACTTCPLHSASDAGSQLVSDCTCNMGYTTNIADASNPRDISDSTDTCTVVECPPDSNGVGGGATCTCNAGYYGSVTWNGNDASNPNTYTSTCTAACGSGYEFLVNGRLTDNRESNTSPDPEFTAAAGYPLTDYTVAECAELCTETTRCVAFTSFAGGAPDESAAIADGDCQLYSLTNFNDEVATTAVCETTPVCSEGVCTGDLTPTGCDTVSVPATAFQPTCVANACVCGTDSGQLDCDITFFEAGSATSNECAGTIPPAGTCAFQCARGFVAGGEHVAATSHVEATCTGTALANCGGIADVTAAAQPESCTGAADNSSFTCDLVSNAQCPDGCTYTAAVPEVRPSCDLNANADCPTGCTVYTCASFLSAADALESSCPAGCDYTPARPASPSSLECTAGGFTAAVCNACPTENKALGMEAIASSEALCSSGVTSDYPLDDIDDAATCGASRVTDGDSTNNNMRWVSAASPSTKNLVVDLEAPHLVVRASVTSGTTCGGPLISTEYSAETTLPAEPAEQYYLELDAGAELSIAGVSVLGKAGSTGAVINATCTGTPTAAWHGLTCDLNASTDGTAECGEGCDYTASAAPGEYVSQFTVQYAGADRETWLPVWICASGTGQCDSVLFTGNSDSDTAQSVLFPEQVTARYLRILPTSVVGSATIRGAIQTCSERTDGLCAYEVQTYSGDATVLTDVLNDVAEGSWATLTAETSLSTEVIGTTQTAHEARFVRLTTGCPGVVSVAELEIFAQACSCDTDADGIQLLYPTDGVPNGGCQASGEGR